MQSNNSNLNNDLKSLQKGKPKGKMRKDDFARINLLFKRWWSWLVYLTVAYAVVYFSWNLLKRDILDFSLLGASFAKNKSDEEAERILLPWKMATLFFFVIIRGVIFCADGLVTSWLKSPFGQICYSINKSGIEDSLSDKIITMLTEVNEHFKETFKKFGVLTISSDLISAYLKIYFPIEQKHSSSIFNHDTIRSLFDLSLVIPIMFALFRVTQVKKMIDSIEIEDE